MNIVWVTSEATPFAKTGGLADVSSALPQALSEAGHKVSVIMPYYPQIMGRLNLRFTSRHALLGVPFGWDKTEWAQIQELKVNDRLSYHFIEFHRFYDRPSLYDWWGGEYSDNGQRFIFLCRAAMQAILALDLRPDILHTNDWHAALCCVYLKSDIYSKFDNFKKCRSILTIHNIGYQGTCDKSNLYWTGLDWSYFNFQCLEFYDKLCLLKGGLMTADIVNTVSPTYAEEILSGGFGFGLDSSLRHCAYHGRLRGILNGIDVKEWSPERDKLLPARFKAGDFAGKERCKEELQRRFNLPVRNDVPLFSIVSRLAHQKGIDVFAEGLEELLENDDMQFVVIGSGDPFLEGRLEHLAQKHPGKFGIYVGYAPDELAHLAEAGADFFVMPSRYEPCGLNQMYSMRYGTLPIVRHTGGLADTVINYDESDPSKSTGFVFWDLYPAALNGTLRWAANVFRTRPLHMNQLRINGMSKDFSWRHTALEYVRMYKDAHR